MLAGAYLSNRSELCMYSWNIYYVSKIMYGHSSPILTYKMEDKEAKEDVGVSSSGATR